jgi:dihydroorotase-like cyclic amidohydrolase
VGGLALTGFIVPSASADIYRWEDEGGVIHFTDDLSSIPPKYRKNFREILKTPAETGKPPLSTPEDSSPPAGMPFTPPQRDGESVQHPDPPLEETASQAEKLRAKIEAKEYFLRTVEEKQSLAINPYRNRLVTPSDLELYKKYKEELPSDREHLKALESRLPPITPP